MEVGSVGVSFCCPPLPVTTGFPHRGQKEDPSLIRALQFVQSIWLPRGGF
jgi:hypothetical protein